VPDQPRPQRVPWWHLRERAVFVIDMFERLERRSRTA